MSQTEDTNELDRYEIILHVVHIVFVTSSGLTSLTRCRIEPENVYYTNTNSRFDGS